MGQGLFAEVRLLKDVAQTVEGMHLRERLLIGACGGFGGGDLEELAGNVVKRRPGGAGSHERSC